MCILLNFLFQYKYKYPLKLRHNSQNAVGAQSRHIQLINVIYYLLTNTMLFTIILNTFINN